jgi:hypothetical protein
VLRLCLLQRRVKRARQRVGSQTSIRQEEVETNGSLSADRLFGFARESFEGTLADREGSLLSAMMPISFRGANDDFQGG